jgi:hypothetical protein
MGITTDDIMEALAREISFKIVSRSAGGIYRLQGKPTKWCGVEMPGPIVTMFFDEKTGILTSSLLQDVMSEKFKRIAQDFIDEEYYNSIDTDSGPD